MKPSISIVIPAYNEAGTIATVASVIERECAAQGIDRYEIIIVDDCSTDGTGPIADNLALQNSHVRAVHNKKNQGAGYNFLIGSKLSKGEYTGYIPGDNEVTREAIHNMLAALGEADIVNTYIANMEIRPWARQVISRSFTHVMNILFRLNLRYFTGPAIIRTSALHRVKRTTFSVAFMMEIIVQLVRAGYSYVEVPMPLQPRRYGRARNFRPKDFWRIFKVILAVFYGVYFTDAVKKLRVARPSS